MKKNIFELFLDKVFNVPLWIKQVMYIKLSQEMKEHACEDFLRNNPEDIYSAYVPIITFKGKTELSERKCGLDNNIYNFLGCCAQNYSILEIFVNTFLSMEEVSKYFELCLEQNFIKAPDSKEIHAMAGFIAGKFRIGEYFKQKGRITVDELSKAILTYKNKQDDAQFGKILVNLGFIDNDELKVVLKLKEESKKRFILDYNTIPVSETMFSDDSQKYEEEINALKQENARLRQKLLQLLSLVKKDA